MPTVPSKSAVSFRISVGSRNAGLSRDALIFGASWGSERLESSLISRIWTTVAMIIRLSAWDLHYFSANWHVVVNKRDGVEMVVPSLVLRWCDALAGQVRRS